MCLLHWEERGAQQTQRVRGLKLVGLMFNFYKSLQGQSMSYYHADAKEKKQSEMPSKSTEDQETVSEVRG